MIKFFRGSGINQVLVIALIAVALWVQYFIAPTQVMQPPGGEAMPLWNLVFNFLSSLPLLGTILSAVLIVIVVVVMIRFNT
ncbi:MAG: hypothetical protein WCD55_11410, partial [Bacteroidales bacterium]